MISGFNAVALPGLDFRMRRTRARAGAPMDFYTATGEDPPGLGEGSKYDREQLGREGL